MKFSMRIFQQIKLGACVFKPKQARKLKILACFGFIYILNNGAIPVKINARTIATSITMISTFLTFLFNTMICLQIT